MAEPFDPEEIPQAIVVAKKRRISVVWVVPLLAALVAIGIAIQRVMSEGPTILIVFKAAEGLEAGKTFVKYKDVNIGQVTAVRLSPDFSKVEVTAKIDKSAAKLMVEDAKFWVVEPRVTLSGVSGLSTLLSGNYIGFEPGKSTKAQREYTGIDIAPIVSSGEPGRQFILKTENLGSLGIGSPIYFRRLEVGEVVAYDLTADGKGVELKAFVKAPYDRYVTRDTRFWNASGLDVSVGAGGFEVRTQSLVALLAGGLAFDAPPFATDNEPASADANFTLYSDQAMAMKQPVSTTARYVFYFSESVRGLSVGAPVTLLGIPAGEVTHIGLDVDPTTRRVRGRVEVLSSPERLIRRIDSKETAATMRSAQERHAFIQLQVEQRGLRAQLRSGSLLTGQLFVALDYFPNAPKAKVDWSKEPVELPVVPSEITDLEQKVTGILAKLDKLPYEAIGNDVTKVLLSLDQALKSANKAVNQLDAEITPGMKTTIEDIRRTIVSADGLLKSTDATLLGQDAPAQRELREALQEITRAARSLRVLTDYLERHPESLIRGKGNEQP